MSFELFPIVSNINSHCVISHRHSQEFLLGGWSAPAQLWLGDGKTARFG